MMDVDGRFVLFGAREYDAKTGRWMEPDPIGVAGGGNRYVYAAGDPVNSIDPSGQRPNIGAAIRGYWKGVRRNIGARIIQIIINISGEQVELPPEPQPPVTRAPVKPAPPDSGQRRPNDDNRDAPHSPLSNLRKLCGDLINSLDWGWHPELLMPNGQGPFPGGAPVPGPAGAHSGSSLTEHRTRAPARSILNNFEGPLTHNDRTGASPPMVTRTITKVSRAASYTISIMSDIARRLVERWSFSDGPQAHLKGFDVLVMRSRSETVEALTKIELALQLIERSDARRFTRMRADVHRIVVTSLASAGAYLHRSRTCYLSESMIASSSTFIVAIVLVHEATHARIDHAGVRPYRDRKSRYETLCIRQELAFAATLPKSEYPTIDEWIATRGQQLGTRGLP